MQIIEKFSVNNDCYKNNVKKVDSRYTNFQANGPDKLMLHSVGTPQPSALVFAKSWNNPGKEVAVHAVLQADGTVYQCLPWNYRGWHAGGSANNYAIGVEMTEPAEIQYTSGSGFKVLDKEKAMAQCRGTYQTACELFAMLCIKYKLDPIKDIISHSEGYILGVASNHGDPEHLWKGLGMGYTMDGFRKDVKAKMSETTDAGIKQENAKLFRVRKSWDDAKSQTGAYEKLENAISECKRGYTVYDETGKAVYANTEAEPLNEKQAMKKLLLEIIRDDPGAVLDALGDTLYMTVDELPNWMRADIETLEKIRIIDGGTEEQDGRINKRKSVLTCCVIALRIFRHYIGMLTDNRE